MSEICLLLTSWACLEKESALAIMAALLSSSSPSFCPLSSRAIRARARSPTTPDAAPFMPSMLPGPGMCWARLREALPAAVSPTVKFGFFLITKDKMERWCATVLYKQEMCECETNLYLQRSSLSRDWAPPPKRPLKKPRFGASGVSTGVNNSLSISCRTETSADFHFYSLYTNWLTDPLRFFFFFSLVQPQAFHDLNIEFQK